MIFTKKNIGIISALVLIILLSQARFFDFLTEYALGRMILLVLITYISYINKFLGLLVVLCIIMAFNYNDTNIVHSYNYYEGFSVDVSGNTIDVSGNTMDLSGNTMDLSGNTMDLSGNIQNHINTIKNTLNTNATANTNTESFYGREGFCMSDKESTILRGKQSNSIPVFNKSRTQSDDVNPSSSSIFSNAYSFLS